MALKKYQKSAIIKKAKEAAQVFFDEYDETLDTAKTDWDAVAWEIDERDLPFSLTDRQAEEAWELYAETLSQETVSLFDKKYAT